MFSGAPDLHQYVNTVQTSPKVFGFNRLHAFAKGGVFAEAGPEAVMPLTRDASGRLGVSASGSSVTVNVINNAAGEGYETKASVNNNNGGLNIELLIVKTMASDMRRNGPITQGLSQVFGLSRSAG